VPPDVQLEPVAYCGARSIKASVIRDMVDGDSATARAVDRLVLFRKARD
jgi:hypothetical protein